MEALELTRPTKISGGPFKFRSKVLLGRFFGPYLKKQREITDFKLFEPQLFDVPLKCKHNVHFWHQTSNMYQQKTKQNHRALRVSLGGRRSAALRLAQWPLENQCLFCKASNQCLLLQGVQSMLILQGFQSVSFSTHGFVFEPFGYLFPDPAPRAP